MARNQRAERCGHFFEKLADKGYHPVFLGGSQALVSFFCNHRKLPVTPHLLRFDSQDDGNYLTALFSFEFSRLQTSGSLFLRFVGRGQVDRVWMMINDFPPEQNPVCTWVFWGYSDEAYLVELPNRYSESPLVYEQTYAFAPWLRILLSRSIVSSDQKRKLLVDYIQFAAQYSPEAKHFRGIGVTNQDLNEFMIFGYAPEKRWETVSFDLSLQSHPRSYLKLVTTAGIMLAEIEDAYLMSILPEMPKQKDNQEYAIICVPTGNIFAHLETEWRVVAKNPYLLITTEPTMTIAQFLASEKNVAGLRQIFDTMFYHPSDPDWW